MRSTTHREPELVGTHVHHKGPRRGEGGRPPVEIPTYNTMHWRLFRDLGKASERTCPCGEQAREWAYDFRDPNELIDSTEKRAGLRYSTDTAHYVALCKLCHVLFDWWFSCNQPNAQERIERIGVLLDGLHGA